MKAKTLLITLLLFSVMKSERMNASVYQQRFEQANKLYREQQYAGAIEMYQQILKEGWISAEVYFNLGNAHFKTGNLPAAILNYERAKRLRPDDSDVDFNLKLANSQTIDKIEPMPEVFYKKWWNKILMQSSAGSRANLAAWLMWISLALAASWLFVPSVAVRRISFVLALLSLLSAISLVSLAHFQNRKLVNRNEAIIYQSNVYVKSSPDETSANLFMLHGGTKVEIKDELNEWYRIRLPNGHEGWLPRNSIEII